MDITQYHGIEVLSTLVSNHPSLLIIDYISNRLLEISDHIVSNHSHKEIVNTLQSHSGPIKMVVSRSIHNEGEESGRREKEMELFKVNQNLEQKLSQQLSLINEWKQKNEKSVRTVFVL